MRLRDGVHGALGAIGFRITRTGKGALGWATRRSTVLGDRLGHPHVFVPEEGDKHRWLQNLGIRTVLDVGAHTGGFSTDIRKILPEASIVSFEPLSDTFAELEKLAATRENHRVLKLALGDTPGRVAMHSNDFSPASSLLAVGEGMRELMPFAATTKEELVDVETLDGVCRTLTLRDHVLVKLDVQGFECHVIRGGNETLRRAKVVIAETSFQPIYEGQPLFEDVYRLLVALGFRYGGSFDQQKSPSDGAPLQEDSIFLR